MDRITIILSTRNRLKKLCAMLSSIPRNDFTDVIVGCDGDSKTYDYLARNHVDWIVPLLTINHVGSVACRNGVTPIVKDGLLYVTDDIKFHNDTLDIALEEFNAHFPDDDGVVGIKQKGTEHHPTGVALVGKTFLRRYPGRQLFYPGYYHFSAQEIHWLASKYDKFYQSERAMITHFHPGPGLIDETHREARIHRERDHRIIKKRKEAGIIWGDRS